MTPVTFPLTGEFIELYKLLKVTGLCESGGTAKHAIAEGLVKVDGAVELRKAFKVRSGHSVEFKNDKISVC